MGFHTAIIIFTDLVRKVVCNGGECDQQCSGKEYSNMECSGKKCTQRCNGQGRGCNMTCSEEECDQKCSGKEYCNMQCSGKKCTQRCNVQGRGCNMTCSGEECDQYCNKKEGCNMHCSGKNCTQRCTGQVKGCNMSCSGREKCKQHCNGGDYCILRCSGTRCDQRCKGHAKECNLTCSGINGVQRCKGQVKSSNMTVSREECDQDSNEKEDCNIQCSGENCIQRCNGQLDKCNMQCNGNTCEQTCRAQTCSMTRNGFRNRLTKQICQGGNGSCYQHVRMQCSMRNFHFKCDRGDQCKASKWFSTDCITSALYTSNVVKTATVTRVQAITTQIPTLQVPFHSPLPKSLSLLLPSPSSTPSSSSSPLLLSSSSPPTPLSPLESIENLVKESVSKFSRIEIRRNSSMQEAITLFEDFTDKYMNISESSKDELGIGEIKTIRESVFRVAVAFEEFALNYGKYHLSGTEPSKKIIRQNMVLSIQKGYRQNSTDFALEEKEWQASINISSVNFAENGSVVIGCVYKELHELLQTNQLIGNENDNSRYVNTRIMTAAMDPKPEKLQQDVILKFKNLEVDDGEKHCMFWSGVSNSLDGFSGNGCHIDSSMSNAEETVCRCNHLTHFAVLVDFSDGPELSTKDLTILEIITYAGLSLSVIGMLLTIALYFFFT
ncbi:adhesion G protein-coupled receptor L4-like isoform X2 [Stylophora pistillata]|uniref:adhesion G protein-coupled receptor L4-like isoform X2 n=1 Tax=Stylophora pistillata TaxID=50429 RepID=UPI000C040FD8|nr:adhesion G protein-coupled receptor L4-like isoform X2 [Stylophora pistillata]